MTKFAEELFEQAITLEPSDRAELVDRLSLFDGTLEPEESGYAQAWAAEIRERKAQIASGEETPVPWREAMVRIRRGEIRDK